VTVFPLKCSSAQVLSLFNCSLLSSTFPSMFN